MKKVFLMLAIAIIVSGMAAAQPTPPPLSTGPTQNPFVDVNAVITESTESRFSGGSFTSDVDDYIDPAYFNPEIGNFLFLGGTGGVAADVQTPTPYAISVGYGKTLGAAYLGLYYAGSLVNASGSTTEGTDPVKDATVSTAEWTNSLAVLFGIAGMGFRLDLVVPGTTVDQETVDGKLSKETTANAPAVALSWGAALGEIPLWAKVGFQFPNTTIETDADPNKAASKTATTSEGAGLGVTVGADIATGETTSILAEIYFGTIFATSYSGDTKDVLTGGPDPYTEGGSLGVGLSASFSKTLTFGEATVIIAPNLDLSFISESNNSTAKNAPKLPSSDWFTLSPGLDVGAEYKHDKVGIYTYFGLSFFEWKTLAFTGGDKDNQTKDSEWEFNGITWLTTGSLAFGVTFEPVEGLVFGTGVTLGVNIDPSAMTIQGSSNRNDITALPSPLTGALAITASYRY